MQVLDGRLGPLGVWGPVRHAQLMGPIGRHHGRGRRCVQGQEVPLSTWGGRQAKLQPIRKPREGGSLELLDWVSPSGKWTRMNRKF